MTTYRTTSGGIVPEHAAGTARRRRTHRRSLRSTVRPVRGDQGFTLIELLVVMIIIGILAAIAIPVFLSQRAKARDAATKSDVSRLGKEIAAYYVDGVGPAVVNYTAPSGSTAATIQITDAGGYAGTVLRLTQGTIQPGSNASSGLGSSTAWCVALTNTNGSQKYYSFSAAGGLQTTAC